MILVPNAWHVSTIDLLALWVMIKSCWKYAKKIKA